MDAFKIQYINLALDYASANEKAFETRPVEKKTISKNVKKSNAIKKKLDEICKKAKQDGELDEIQEYMHHQNKYVKCITAMYCLFIDSQTALNVLEELEKLPPPNPIGAQAFTVLHAWRRGGYDNGLS